MTDDSDDFTPPTAPKNPVVESMRRKLGGYLEDERSEAVARFLKDKIKGDTTKQGE